MSGTEEVHVDTPEQAAARQLVETNQRVTHVAAYVDPQAKEDHSLQALVTVTVGGKTKEATVNVKGKV